MTKAAATPYSQLDPSAVLTALDAVSLAADGRLLQLNSYENRVYQAGLEDGRFGVVKFYRPGRWSSTQILEEHTFAAELAAEEIPVVAPWALSVSGLGEVTLHGVPPTLAEMVLGATSSTEGAESGQAYRFSVSPRKAGRPPEFEDPATLEWIGRFIGRIHAVGQRQPFSHRLSLTPQTLGWEPREWLLNQQIIPADLESTWATVSQTVLERVDEAFDRIQARPLRLHGDCHIGNLLWTPEGPHFVDLDDAMTGPAVQDLWMLLSGDADEARRQLSSLLRGYEDFCDFNDAELKLIEPLRSLRMIRHSTWLAQRWEDPAFPVGFPWFGSHNYWQQQILQLREQLVAMEG